MRVRVARIVEAKTEDASASASATCLAIFLNPSSHHIDERNTEPPKSEVYCQSVNVSFVIVLGLHGGEALNSNESTN